MNYDIVIVGGGIVGLATALKVSEKHPDLKVVILEKESALAAHQTGNNSGVIHAGVYYKPGSLKAHNCRKGYQMLIDFCDKEGLAYELCGKLIVATSDAEVPRLQNLYERSKQNGLQQVYLIPGEEIAAFEPHAVGKLAMVVPYTGIVNYTDVSNKYAEVFQRRGGRIALNTKVLGVRDEGGHCIVETSNGDYRTKLLVNTAGLYSDKVATFGEGKINTRIIPFRGEYVKLKEEKRHLVKNLIYPVPDPEFPFLGVHFTRMIDGEIEAGPNAVWAFKKEGYHRSSFNLVECFESLAWPGFRKVMRKHWKMGLGEYWRSYNKAALARALQRLVPAIQKEDLSPGGAGVRAQACDRTGGLVDDFLILEAKNMFNVLNAPSPAATASLAIGDTLSDKILQRFEPSRLPQAM